jgi:hypothetical protein
MHAINKLNAHLLKQINYLMIKKFIVCTAYISNDAWIIEGLAHLIIKEDDV